MTETTFPYKPKTLTSLLVIGFFGLCAALFIHLLLSNDVGLIVNGIFEFSVTGANIFYGCLGLASLLFVVGGIMGFVKSLGRSRVVILGETSISAPKSAMSKKIIKVNYTDVSSWHIQAVQSQRILTIVHRDGKLTIPRSLLPNKQAFEELVVLFEEKTREHGTR